MIQGNYMDQVIRAKGGKDPCSWSFDHPNALRCRNWGAVHGFMPMPTPTTSSVSMVAIDAQKNRATRVLPLLSDPMANAPAGFSRIEAGPFPLGYHPSPGRDAVLNHLQNHGHQISAQLAREQWPAAVVHLDAYCIQSLPVTNAQYLEFVGKTGRTNPLAVQGKSAQPFMNHPVANITYEDAIAYCDWKTEHSDEPWIYRLPTDWQWEKAARGPWGSDTGWSGRLFPWGDRWGKGNAHCRSAAADSTAPTTTRGLSSWGVGDLVGNVSEWVDAGGMQDDGQTFRHARSSSWEDEGPFYGLCFVNDIKRCDPGFHGNWLGFRCVAAPRTNPPEQALVPLGDDMFTDGRGEGQFIGRFLLARFAVSNEEYMQFKPTHQFASHERYWPVTNVSHQDAVNFCAWKTQEEGRVYCLPSKAHWERACMGTCQKRYPWLAPGQTTDSPAQLDLPEPLSFPIDDNGYSRYLCNSLESGFGHPIDVFSLWMGASSEGVYQLCGNVFEWLSDRYAVGGNWLSTCETYGTWPYSDGDGDECGPQPGVGFRYMTY